MVFIGDLLPVFVIGLLFTLQPFSLYVSIGFLAVIAISGYGSYYLSYKLKESLNYNSDISFDPKKDGSLKLVKIEDRGGIYTTYMITFVSIIPLINHGYLGLLAFALIILVVYSIYSNSDMLFYNPVLALRGYKFYRIELNNEDEIYAISKLNLKKRDFEKDLKFYQPFDYFYYIVPTN